ncbi:protein SHQ1 homolog [Anopheles maculipalpis]|uniref:protein SHQ1 homolog n=1 Tax=Anopheles maculipalpis TaxID=1496333 RepID=UPI0021594139|nr:protein SHQ1 homolog [Anopheles maculipalpis]
MDDSLSFRTTLESNHILVILDLPELDLEHESNLVLNIFPKECTFTAAPYHASIPLSHPAHPGKAFPKYIDYEKSTVTFRVPLAVDVKTVDNEFPSYPYGFCRLYSGPLSLETSQELKVLSDPDKYSFAQRWKLKEEAEKHDFHGEHYGMDYIQFAIDKLGLTLDNLPASSKLTDDQSYRIRVIVEEKIRNQETYTSCIEDHKPLVLGLIDVLLAVRYDRLTNNNELNEANSHINIHRISSTLAYFAEFHSVEQMLHSFYRRSCTYPYYRSKEIALVCVQHVLTGISSADRKVWIQFQLLHAYEAFKTTECAVLNHYFVKDYIRYVELGLDEETLFECVENMQKILPDIHQAALGFGEEKLIQKLLQDIITQEESDSTDSDDYGTTDSESDESDTDNESSSSSSSSAVSASEEDTNPNENVLEKLMNLKLSG